MLGAPAPPIPPSFLMSEQTRHAPRPLFPLVQRCQRELTCAAGSVLRCSMVSALTRCVLTKRVLTTS